MLSQYIETLAKFRQFWNFQPFQNIDYSTYSWPQTLIDALDATTDEELANIDSDIKLQREFFAPWFAEVYDLPEVATVIPSQKLPVPFWLENGIGGRKIEQIKAFISQLPLRNTSILEWCSGKGHLGRLIAFSQNRQVTSIEWQSQLCESGQSIAQQYQLPQNFIHADVMKDDLSSTWDDVDCAVALHACGDLHIELIQQGAATHCTELMIAPCCYHLTASDIYKGLSQCAQDFIQTHDLSLTREHLKLAVQGQVTAGARVARLRHTEVQWRLAYHEIYQWITGNRSYQPLSSVAKHWFSGEFKDFVQWAAEQHHIQLPECIDWQLFLEKGRQAASQVARLEFVRHVFRRPLESMLVLDRAEYLRESGYNVAVREFCSYQLTPRNFLIHAQLM
ncbi:methyltransferase [Pseudidiomarina marina]|uniref:Methyltransferase n=1 Tax=Pseudidiomarina marina TaxID=502366 RepID=A0A432YIU6_9GAMM|nr:methyltransferase [Pseudidiomarina marina]RUO60897.1 methyltransferase [Pseudidiomarina marina]